MNRAFFFSALASLLGLVALAGSAWAGGREIETVDSAAGVLEDLSAIPARCIPPALMADAQGVVIVPDVIKAGFVLGGRHGRGVMLIRQQDGTWSNPIFISLSGGSIGWQIGIQATDVVLVFKTRGGLDRIMRGQGKLTLGADLSVAAGPIGRQAEADTDGQFKAEIYSYSRSRGLFAGASLEGAALLIDGSANDAFYGVRGKTAGEILAMRGAPIPAVVLKLQTELAKISAAPPPVVVPLLQPPAPPVLLPPPMPLPPGPPR